MEDDFDLTNLKKKKRVNSRAKGNSFERKVAKILNERFNTKDFSRTPGSGAFATTHTLPKHLKIYGDLITPEKFRFVIECKKGYNKENLSSLFSKKSEFWKFIKQAEKDSENSGKPFMILLQQDRKEIMCIRKDCFHVLPPEVIEVKIKNYSIFLLTDFLILDDEYFLDSEE
jgi:SPX domain protein involved in polyphosphate accumulation